MKKNYKIIIGCVLVIAALVAVGFVVVHAKSAVSAAAGPGTVATAAPQSAAAQTPPKNPIQVPVLVYHMFGPQASVDESPMQLHYRVTQGAFDAQMAYLAKNNYTPITFNDYVNYLRNGTALPAKPIVLTFDDGWETQYTYAFPILQKYHFVGTFFIISSYPGYPAYMSWAQIIALDRAGMEIGSHTVHHVDLTEVTPQILQSEIVDSKTAIEAELKHQITTFAYPKYAQNLAVQAAIAGAGYAGARAGWSRSKNSASTVYQISSQEVVNNPDPFSRIRLPDTQTP